MSTESKDGLRFKIEEAAALQSQTIKQMVEGGLATNNIPLPNVKSNTLAKVIMYLKKHVKDEEGKNDDEKSLKQFDKYFVDVDQSVLFDLILAADNLEIEGLLHLTCETVASMIKGKSPQQISNIFNITPEEEEAIRNDSKKNQ